MRGGRGSSDDDASVSVDDDDDDDDVIITSASYSSGGSSASITSDSDDSDDGEESYTSSTIGTPSYNEDSRSDQRVAPAKRRGKRDKQPKQAAQQQQTAMTKGRQGISAGKSKAKKISKSTKKMGRVGRLRRLFDHTTTSVINSSSPGKNENRGHGVGRGNSSSSSRGQTAGEASLSSAERTKSTLKPSSFRSVVGGGRGTSSSADRGTSSGLKSTSKSATGTTAARRGGGIGDDVSTESAQLSELLHEITDGLDDNNTLDTPCTIDEDNTLTAASAGDNETIGSCDADKDVNKLNVEDEKDAENAPTTRDSSFAFEVSSWPDAGSIMRTLGSRLGLDDWQLGGGGTDDDSQTGEDKTKNKKKEAESSPDVSTPTRGNKTTNDAAPPQSFLNKATGTTLDDPLQLSIHISPNDSDRGEQADTSLLSSSSLVPSRTQSDGLRLMSTPEKITITHDSSCSLADLSIDIDDDDDDEAAAAAEAAAAKEEANLDAAVREAIAAYQSGNSSTPPTSSPPSLAPATPDSAHADGIGGCGACSPLSTTGNGAGAQKQARSPRGRKKHKKDHVIVSVLSKMNDGPSQGVCGTTCIGRDDNDPFAWYDCSTGGRFGEGCGDDTPLFEADFGSSSSFAVCNTDDKNREQEQKQPEQDESSFALFPDPFIFPTAVRSSSTNQGTTPPHAMPPSPTSVADKKHDNEEAADALKKEISELHMNLHSMSSDVKQLSLLIASQNKLREIEEDKKAAAAAASTPGAAPSSKISSANRRRSLLDNLIDEDEQTILSVEVPLNSGLGAPPSSELVRPPTAVTKADEADEVKASSRQEEKSKNSRVGLSLLSRLRKSGKDVALKKAPSKESSKATRTISDKGLAPKRKVKVDEKKHLATESALSQDKKAVKSNRASKQTVAKDKSGSKISTVTFDDMAKRADADPVDACDTSTYGNTTIDGDDAGNIEALLDNKKADVSAGEEKEKKVPKKDQVRAQPLMAAASLKVTKKTKKKSGRSLFRFRRPKAVSSKLKDDSTGKHYEDAAEEVAPEAAVNTSFDKAAASAAAFIGAATNYAFPTPVAEDEDEEPVKRPSPLRRRLRPSKKKVSAPESVNDSRDSQGWTDYLSLAFADDSLTAPEEHEQIVKKKSKSVKLVRGRSKKKPSSRSHDYQDDNNDDDDNLYRGERICRVFGDCGTLVTEICSFREVACMCQDIADGAKEETIVAVTRVDFAVKDSIRGLANKCMEFAGEESGAKRRESMKKKQLSSKKSKKSQRRR